MIYLYGPLVFKQFEAHWALDSFRAIEPNVSRTSSYSRFFFFLNQISHSLCALFFSEDYDEQRATAHVRRVLDIVACTTSFGASPSPTKDQGLKLDASSTGSGKNAPGAQDKSAKKSTTTNTSKSQVSTGADKRDVAVDSETEMSHSCLKLGSFYDFFSLSHLTPPLQCTLSVLFISSTHVCMYFMA